MILVADLIALFVYALSNGWGYIWGTSGGVWTKAQQEKATREMTVKYGAKWIGKHVADCSGLFTWAFKKLGGYMYHGSDTMFRKYTTANGTLSKGKRTDGQTLKPGTAVFTWKESEKKYGHVGLFIGEGKVIEAHGTIKGVIKSDVTDERWTHWGELKGVNYSDNPQPVPETKPTLRKGDKGAYVILAQTELINKGYSCGKSGADGIFGSNTEAAVKAFQKDHGLKVDGIIGDATWNALDGAEPAILYTVTVKGLTESQADALIKQYPGSTKTEERG